MTGGGWSLANIVSAERRVYSLCITKVGAHGREAWGLIEESKTGLLERDVVVVVEVVEPTDAIPASVETKRRVEADEAGCAGYEDYSWQPLPFVSSFKVAASGVPTFTSKPK